MSGGNTSFVFVEREAMLIMSVPQCTVRQESKVRLCFTKQSGDRNSGDGTAG